MARVSIITGDAALDVTKVHFQHTVSSSLMYLTCWSNSSSDEDGAGECDIIYWAE